MINIRVLFWNLQRGHRPNKDAHNLLIEDAVAFWLTQNTVLECDATLLLFAECNKTYADNIMRKLSDSEVRWGQLIHPRGDKSYLKGFVHIQEERSPLLMIDNIAHIYLANTIKGIPDLAKKFMAIRLVVNDERYLIFLVHLYDKGQAYQSLQNQELIKMLYLNEHRFFEHLSPAQYPTLIVGDFNYNPFDSFMHFHPAGITHKENLYFNHHHEGYLKTISHREANIQFRENDGFDLSDYFYNPCWNLLGDFQPDSPHPKVNFTHQHDNIFTSSKRKAEEIHQNLLDQVILRPSLIPHFKHEDLQIVPLFCNPNDDDNPVVLIKDNLHRVQNEELLPYSDHFAIQFSLKFESHY